MAVSKGHQIAYKDFSGFLHMALLESRVQ